MQANEQQRPRLSLQLRWLRVVSLLAVHLVVSPDASAQSIRGRVVDDLTLQRIATVEVVLYSGAVVIARAVTDSAGVFVITAGTSGSYRLSARALGYATVDSLPIDLRAFTQTDVLIRLSASAIGLPSISVQAMGLDLRHRATFEGFHARREIFPPIGNRRAVHKDDPEMIASQSIWDVLSWFPKPFCLIVYIDGAYAVPAQAEMYMDLPVSRFEGIEYYRYGDEAPLEMRGGRGTCSFAVNYTVLAIWRSK